MKKLPLLIALVPALIASTHTFAGNQPKYINKQPNQIAKQTNQPRMEKALLLLELAQEQLQQATPNKGGHRAKAMNQVRNAMHQVRQGMQFANNKQYRQQKQY